MTTAPAAIKIYLLGKFRVESQTRLVKLPTSKTTLLLAYLSLHAQRPIRRAYLADLFWGTRANADDDALMNMDDAKSLTAIDKKAAASLRVALSQIRKELGPDLIVDTYIGHEAAVQFDATQVWADAIAFKQQAKAFLNAQPIDPTLAPLELYQGELLPAFDDDSEERWLEQERTTLRQLQRDVHLRLTRYLRAQGEYMQALDHAQKAIELDAYQEEAYQHALFCHFRLGQREQALKVYRALQNELGDELSPETKQLYLVIRKSKEQHTPAPTDLTNLPTPLTRFIGRERELTALQQRLAPDSARTTTRLVTLTGPGGCGKTRLAIQVASALLNHYGDGVWWASLEALTDEAEVLRAVAKSLGVREQTSRSLLEIVTDYLRDKQLLLVLDNCEHVLNTCAQLCEQWAQACPRLQILTTSRERLGLHLAGEIAYEVPSLALPTTPELPPLTELSQIESIYFFVDRTRVEQPTFALTTQNAPSVAQICRRLDGIPLALELAAARVKGLGVDYIANHLDDRFNLLSRGHRTLPRHQTLRAAIDWSYHLLDGAEKQLFAQLGVFAGRFTLEAVEQVCVISQSAVSVRELLQSLVDQSLVEVMGFEQTSGGEVVRYRLLETIRQYARETLAASPSEAEATYARMASYYLKFAQQRRKDYLVLEREWENISLGIRVAHRQQRWEDLIGYGYAVTEACFARGFYTEARALAPWLREAAVELEDQDAYIMATLHWGQACAEQSDYAEAKQHLNDALAVCRDVNDAASAAAARYYLGWVAYKEHQYDEAWQLLEQSYTAHAQQGKTSAAALALFRLAQIAYDRQDYDEVVRLGEQALTLQQSLKDERGSIRTLTVLAQATNAQGRLATAEEYGQRALKLCESTLEQDQLAWALYVLAGIKRRQAQLDMARELASQSLMLFRKLGDRKSVTAALYDLSRIYLAQNNHALALSTVEESLNLLRSMKDSWFIVFQLQQQGDVFFAWNKSDEAQKVWQEALNIAEHLTHPLSHSLRERLSNLPTSPV